MSPILLVIGGAFAIIMLVVLGVYWALVVRPESRERSRLKQRLKVDPAAIGQNRSAEKLEKKAEAHEIFALDQMLLWASRPVEAISKLIKQSDVKLSVSGFLLLSPERRRQRLRDRVRARKIAPPRAAGRSLRHVRSAFLPPPQAESAHLEIRGAVSGGNRPDRQSAPRRTRVHHGSDCTAPGSLDTHLCYAAWRSSYSSRASIGV